MPHLRPGPLLVATHNQGKIKEFAHSLEPLGVEIVSAADRALPAPEETGTTFTENAVLKAKAASVATGEQALADDSGLSISVLGGAPGVRSARFAEEAGGYAGAFARLQEELGEGASGAEAAFVCVLALVLPGGATLTAEGRCEGTLLFPPRGDGGFGYDPIFIPEGETRTLGEMSPSEKAKFSHRARALAALRATLDEGK